MWGKKLFLKVWKLGKNYYPAASVSKSNLYPSCTQSDDFLYNITIVMYWSSFKIQAPLHLVLTSNFEMSLVNNTSFLTFTIFCFLKQACLSCFQLSLHIPATASKHTLCCPFMVLMCILVPFVAVSTSVFSPSRFNVLSQTAFPSQSTHSQYFPLNSDFFLLWISIAF